MVFAECLLVYMPPRASSAVIEWFGRRARRAMLVAYEMVGPDDPFGRTMVDNLRRRGCPLLGLRAVPDVAAQEARMLACGWSRAEAIEMLPFFDSVVCEEERRRVCRIAMLDELEEWRLLLSHYCVALAVNDDIAAHDESAASPLFDSVALRKPVLLAPLVMLGGRDEQDAAASPAAAASQAASAQMPPLGDMVFREEDEDAVWSDDEPEEEAQAEVVSSHVVSFIDSSFTSKVEYEAWLKSIHC